MKLLSLDHKINHSAWYLIPSYFQSLRATAESAQEKLLTVKHGELEDFLAMLVNQRPPLAIDSNGVAVISISGVLARDCSQLEKLLGLVDYDDVDDDIDECLLQGAKAILFDIDSPGGEAMGCPELASTMADIEVPKAAFSSGLMCSAAYFLACSADKMFASPSALVGSIGTIFPFIDTSKLWDAIGLDWQPITGQDEKLKGAGMGPSLSDTQREHLQEQVNAASAAFRDHVSDYREVDFSKLQAGAYSGQQALNLNLIDKIGSYDQAYEYLMRKI